MKKTLLYAALAVLTVGIATSAIASEHKKGSERGYKGKIFKTMDVNSDGEISKSEFLSKAKERFAKMDVDSDNKITKEEAKNHRALMKEKHKKDNL